MAVLAHEHKIPFYVAAPISTIDLATPDGDHIPIEERDQREVTHLGTSRLTPEGAQIRNPAFDVTPHRYITGIITERGHFRCAVHRVAEAALASAVAARRRSARRPSAPMHLLAIETSCDETAAAVIEETGDAAGHGALRSNVVASQAAIHREWGGVVPELASRQHVRDICGVVEAALAEARRRRCDDIGAVAVTQGPGLVGSLLVGVAFAKAFAWSRGIPVIPVHHLAGHIESLVLAARRAAAAGGGARRLGRPHQPVPDSRARRATS